MPLRLLEMKKKIGLTINEFVTNILVLLKHEVNHLKIVIMGDLKYLRKQFIHF